MSIYWIVYIIVYSLYAFGFFGSLFLCLYNKRKVSAKSVALSFVFGNLMINEYMCAFNGWKIAEYCVGGSFLFLSLYGLLINFSYKSGIYKKISVAPFFDLVASVALSIRLIYIIEDESLKAILIPVIAAVFGGLITLSGVILTINHSNEQKKQEEINKNKPIIFPMTDEMMSNVHNKIINRPLSDGEGTGNLPQADSEAWYEFWPICLYNSDNSICAFVGYMVDDKYRLFKYNCALDKSTYNTFYPTYKFKLDEKPKEVSLLIGDMLSNTYKIDFSFEIIPEKKHAFIKITGVLGSTIVDINKFYHEDN